jgi:catechol 2,3-dioxygenase-like lactoylglutathione lyase family enzyme
MNQHLAHIAILVKNYDEAIAFYTKKLNFTLVEDSKLSETKRWVLVKPKGDGQCCLLLAQASTEQQAGMVGDQTGGRVFLFLYTDDFWRDYNNMLEQQIHFVRPPIKESYGTVAVFEDLYGNRWDLIEP